MKITPENFFIKFTNAELAFAASALGFHRLVLFNQEDWGDLEQLMEAGKRSLQARGLLRQDAAQEMKMDVFLDGLIHWTQDPDWVMTFQVHRPTIEDAWTVFFRQDYLLCHHISEAVEFTLFESADQARSNILRQIGLGIAADPLAVFQQEKSQAVIDVSLWQKRQGEMIWLGNKRFQNTPQGSFLEKLEANESHYRAVSVNDLLSMDFI